MRIISNTRCVIGEGPIWNEREQLLYFVDSFSREIHKLDISTGKQTTQKGIAAAAVAFAADGRVLVSADDGIFALLPDGTLSPLYNTDRYRISHANDMKVGPDGCLYVGTQSSKRLGLSDQTDGALYRITPDGEVRCLLEGLLLSNGMDWSMDEKRFYHTDSDTKTIREYHFARSTGEITPTGRLATVPGVDGFTIDRNDRLYVACWGKGHIAVVNTATMTVEAHLPVPAQIPASCAFAGERMDALAIVTATYGAKEDPNAGCTFLHDVQAVGRKPFVFG